MFILAVFLAGAALGAFVTLAVVEYTQEEVRRAKAKMAQAGQPVESK